MLEMLSPEVRKWIKKAAKTCQATEIQVLEMMALSFMAERRAQVVEGFAASEIDTFPREEDGTLMQGRDCYQYAAIKHRRRLQEIRKAGEMMTQLGDTTKLETLTAVQGIRLPWPSIGKGASSGRLVDNLLAQPKYTVQGNIIITLDQLKEKPG